MPSLHCIWSFDKVQPLDLLFIVAFISFYISRYHFSQIFKTSFSIIWGKDFYHEFSLLNGFTQTPTPHLHPPTKWVESYLPIVPKTVAWAQHLFLHYLLFTYFYLFSLNIISNLLSQHAINVTSLMTINNWLLNFLAEFVC